MLDYLDDIASDLSVFHRVDDVLGLSGPVFFKLVWRLPAYEGVMRAVVLAEHEESAGSPGAPTMASRSSHGGEWNPGTKATLQADPALKGLFSFG